MSHARQPSAKELLAAAKRAGWRIEHGGKHIKVFVPGRDRAVTFCYGSEVRKLHVQAKVFRQAGLDV